MCAPVQSREELVRCECLQKKREKISTRGYYHNTLTGCDVQRRNECMNSAKQRRVGAVLVDLQMKEKRFAQENIIIMHSPSVMDNGETSVCTENKSW